MRTSDSLLEMLCSSAAANPRRPLLISFDTVLSVGEVHRLSDAFAAALADRGFAAGDRLALYLQNVPQYVIALIGVWKAGGIAVAINPMLTPGEIAKLITDSAPSVFVALTELHSAELSAILAGSSVQRIITTSALDWQSTDDHRVLPLRPSPTPIGAEDLRELLARYDGVAAATVSINSDDVAVITYTSGTTGTPKGAMNTHRNVVTGGHAYRDWFRLDEQDVVLGVAPLFHVTGLTGHISCAIVARAALVLAYRFDTHVIVDMIRTHRPTFTVGAITVFIALANAPEVSGEDLASLTKIASGGAPVAAATADRFEKRFGTRIHNVYGMTETTCPVLAVPLGSSTPVSAETGARSVGIPMPSTRITVLDEAGAELPAGQLGELAVRGPQVVPGYWGNDAETAAAFHDGWLLTGDIGYTDEKGWYYLVDRKKDMIVASGYKVWPREVEDVLYAHQAVLEAGVVGQPDPYRGESVKAYVALRPGFSVRPEELVDFCRQRMAAYKYPREVEIVDAIPKTATGKILRRRLRSGNVPTAL